MSLTQRVSWMLFAGLGLAALILIGNRLAEIRNALARPPVVVTVVCPAGTAMVLASQENVWTCVDAKEAG